MTVVPGVPRLLRVINDRSALDLLVERGPLSRPQLAQLTGLSHPTTTRLLDRLERGGLVVSAGFAAGGKGPNSRLFAINAGAGHVAAVDVTPSAIDVAVVDLVGEVVARHRLTASVGRGLAAATRVRMAVDATVRQIGISTEQLAFVAIGTPGSVNPGTGLVEYADHLVGWQVSGVTERIRDALGVDVRIDNDVNLAALAEHRIGVAQGRDDFALFWMGEGLGLALVMDGALRRGHTGGAGEVSYLPVPGRPPSGPLNASSAGDYQLTAGAPAVVELGARFGVAGRTPAAIVRAALGAGSTGQDLLRELAYRTACGLAAVVCVLDPEVIVLAGPTGLAGGAVLCDLVADALTPITVRTPAIVPSAIVHNPVQAGAIITALAEARGRLFGGGTALSHRASGP